MIRHPDFWFDDGSALVIVGDTIYKLHRSLVVRLSPHFFDKCCLVASVPNELSTDSSTPCYSLRNESNISKADFEALIAYIVHDVVLTNDTPFETLLRLYIVSAEENGDFRKIHDATEKRLSAIMQSHPLDLEFTHPDLLGKAFNLSRDGENSQLAKLLKRAHYYAYATHDEDSLGSDRLATDDEKYDPAIAERVMSRLSDTFSPMLFQPPAALHMQCTDVYANLWMERAIGPAFEEHGTADPFKTLRRLRKMDWKRKCQVPEERSEPCEECFEHMRHQWSDDAQSIWEILDGWLVEEK